MQLKEYAERKIRDVKKWNASSWKDKKMAQFLDNDSVVLDIGCWPAILSQKFGIQNYFGVDYNEYFVENGIKNWLQVSQLDLSTNDLPFEDDTFDLIYCSHVIEHLETDRQIHLFFEIQRVLKNDGVLFMFAPTPYHWYFWDDPTHKRPVTHKSLEQLAKDTWLHVFESKYSFVRGFSNNLQRWLRLPPLRWFLWEVYIIARK